MDIKHEEMIKIILKSFNFIFLPVCLRKKKAPSRPCDRRRDGPLQEEKRGIDGEAVKELNGN